VTELWDTVHMHMGSPRTNAWLLALDTHSLHSKMVTEQPDGAVVIMIWAILPSMVLSQELVERLEQALATTSTRHFLHFQPRLCFLRHYNTSNLDHTQTKLSEHWDMDQVKVATHLKHVGKHAPNINTLHSNTNKERRVNASVTMILTMRKSMAK